MGEHTPGIRAVKANMVISVSRRITGREEIQKTGVIIYTVATGTDSQQPNVLDQVSRRKANLRRAFRGGRLGPLAERGPFGFGGPGS
jgi:hypothetical protein